jgi:hypothetical protein
MAGTDFWISYLSALWSEDQLRVKYATCPRTVFSTRALGVNAMTYFNLFPQKEQRVGDMRGEHL